MIQIRTSMFETNSSSCNALIVPMHQEIRFSTIACSEGLDYLLDHAYGTKGLIQWLYSEGVEEIKYNGNNSYVRREINEVKYSTEAYDLRVGLDSTYLSKDILKLIIFGEETSVETRSDSRPLENDDELVFLGSRC